MDKNLPLSILVFLQFPQGLEEEEIGPGSGQGYLVFPRDLASGIAPVRMPDEIPEDLRLAEGQAGYLFHEPEGCRFFLFLPGNVFPQLRVPG